MLQNILKTALILFLEFLQNFFLQLFPRFLSFVWTDKGKFDTLLVLSGVAQ